MLLSDVGRFYKKHFRHGKKMQNSLTTDMIFNIFKKICK